jgi:hypothetical protein
MGLSPGSALMYESPGIHVRLALAAIPHDIELRFWLACKLLLPKQIRVDVQTWNGEPCDILVTDLDCTYGRIAYELATRDNDVLTLCFSESDYSGVRNSTRLDRQITASALAVILQEILALQANVKIDVNKGLLGICLIEASSGYELLARNGAVSVIVRHNARRIHAHSLHDLMAAESRLLEPSWSVVPLSAPYDHQYEGLIFRSLDSFLISACYQHQADLPLLNDDVYQLKQWPDLGMNPLDTSSLRLASALQRKFWQIEELARHCGVARETANAFGWATLASGALAVVDTAKPKTRSEPDPIPPVIRRIARHFGLKAS